MSNMNSQNNLNESLSLNSVLVLLVEVYSLRKQTTFRDASNGFPAK